MPSVLCAAVDVLRFAVPFFYGLHRSFESSTYTAPIRQTGDLNSSYYSGGAGYILTRASLDRLGRAVGDNVTHTAWAEPSNGPEDAMMSRTLLPLGIQTERCATDDGRELFLPMGTGFEQKQAKRNENLWLYAKSPFTVAGPACCSEQWVSTHCA